jgi:hypothetical protein
VNPVETVFGEIRQLVSDQFAASTAQRQATIQDTLAAVNSRIAAVREQNERDEAAFDQMVQAEMAALRQADAAFRERAMTQVAQLNTELADVTGHATALASHLSGLREELAGTLHGAREVEEASLLALKSHVEGALTHLQNQLDDMPAASSLPLRFLASCVVASGQRVPSLMEGVDADVARAIAASAPGVVPVLHFADASSAHEPHPHDNDDAAIAAPFVGAAERRVVSGRRTR